MEKKSKELLSHKIFTKENLLKEIGKFPRNNKVILCHGTFDIVHPGHIRHLMHAKTQGSKLIVSITGDKHIFKTNYRPFVPEDMRAFNLAALEIVDYVIIDENDKPIELINFLKPDFFAKGYEYNAEKIHEKTKEELDIINSYGGDIIFTPGDIVFSSSKIIEDAPPNLSMEKLQLLMEAENIKFNDLKDTINSFKDISVHILGDTIIDSYTNCSMISSGMSKTPTMSLKFEYSEHFTGGAAIVAKHLKSAGAKVKFTTLLGNDELAKNVLKDLKSNNIDTNPIIDSNRPSTNKNAIVCNNYRLLKIDTLDNKTISDKILNDFINAVKKDNSSITILSDFRHGIFNKSTIPIFCDSIDKETFKVADSQVASRWGNITEFKGFDLITPNEKEARFALGDQDSHIRPLASELYRLADCKLLILKLGEKGVLSLRNIEENDPRRLVILDSFTDKSVDPVGAGDALLAYSSLAMKVSKNEIISVILGNIAAGLECEENGNIAISNSKMIERINEIENRVNYSN